MDILPDDAPAPRLCHLIKWPDFDGYGFNLHAERANPGQFIGKIDDESPAQMAGLREGDRIVEVNGVNISNENHRQVVERIKTDPKETRLLVVDAETDAWYREQDLVIKSSQLNVVYMKTPVPRPEPDSPRAKFHQQEDQQSASKAEARSEAGTTSSLDTSDFNDDSIEQQQQQHHHQKAVPNSGQLSPANGNAGSVDPPPMSPDSGRGPDDEDLTHLMASGDVLTVEAEINRQSPRIVEQLVGDDEQDCINGVDETSKEKDEELIGVRSATNLTEETGGQVETDSLNCDAKQQDVQQKDEQQDEQKQEDQNTRSKLDQTITSSELPAFPAIAKQVSRLKKAWLWCVLLAL